MTEIKITELSSDEHLLVVYPRQNGPQDCYLKLDTRSGDFGADYNPEIGNAIPFTVYYGHVRRYPIPLLRAVTINALLHELAPLAGRVADGASIHWNGRNNVTELTTDALGAEREITAILAPYWEGGDPDLHWADAGDWMYDSRDEIRERLKAGESVDALMKEFEGDGNAEDQPILIGLRDYIERLAEEQRAGN